MRLSLLVILVFVFTTAYSQNFKEKELKTEIREVTVFLSGAQIFETGTVAIPAGKTILKVKNLSPYLDDKSIQVKAEGDFTILSVNHKFNYLTHLKRDETIDSLEKVIEGIALGVSRENARLEVLTEKLSVLHENRKMSGANAGATITQLKQAIDFYEAEITKIKEEEIRTRKSIEQKKEDQKRLEQQVKELNDQATVPSSEIEIRTSAEAQVNTKFSITYLVGNAGWYPKYDIRVKSIKSPLELAYKAEVFQNTGVDWKNVKLKFSNGDPNQSGVMPELNPWRLHYTNAFYEGGDLYGSRTSTAIRMVKGKVMGEDGAPLPGVNVVVKGSTIGTVTDVNGNYSLTLPNGSSTLVFSFIGMTSQELAVSQPEMNIRMQPDATALQEVVVTGYGVRRNASIRIRGVSSIRNRDKDNSLPMATTVVENQTTVEIEVDMPYSIKSNGEKLQVDLKKYGIEAAYEYYAVPKIDKDAFLVARVTNWDQYHLLEGEANLYFEDAFVGRSILDAKALKDTLTISLGRDRSIVLGRTKNEQFSKKKAIGSNMVETRGFKIVARNKKSQPIKLTLFDQIPVSLVSDITVSPVELTRGQFDDKTGKVTWELNIDPQQQKEINLQYEVKYPKRERVVLE